MEIGAAAVIDYWQNVLGAFDWPSYRINAMIGLWENDMHDDASMFWHKSQAYYLAFELVTELADLPTEVKASERSTKDCWELPCGIQHIIEKRTFWDANERVFKSDWGQLKGEILKFLSQYGKTIKVRRPVW